MVLPDMQPARLLRARRSVVALSSVKAATRNPVEEAQGHQPAKVVVS